MTLFIPDHVPGFVSAKDGSVSLNRMLIPIAAKPRPQTFLWAERFAATATAEGPESVAAEISKKQNNAETN